MKKLFLFPKFFRIFAPEFSDGKQMVRQRIIEEASELFGRSGIKSITMDELARHLGISKRTIYENFKDKETLLIACFEAYHEQKRAFSQKVFLEADNVADAIMVLLRKDTEEASQRQFNVMDDIRKYYPQVYRKHLADFHTDKCRELGQMITRGIKEGVFRENLNPEIIVHFFSSQVDNIHQDNYLSKFSVTDVFENLALTFLRGICTAKGLEIIDQYKEKLSKS
jgi:AcrR family transcriptional regulator